VPFISKLLRGGTGRSLTTGLLAFLLLAVLVTLDAGRRLENFALDFCYRLRPPSPPPAHILIVGIDTASFQELRRPWPWPRRWHAELIRRLTAAGAALIVFDVFFGEPSTEEDDRLLAEAIRDSRGVILARIIEVTQDPRFSRQIVREPLPQFCAGACDLAVILHTPDPDKVVRRFHLSPAGQVTLAEVVARRFSPQHGMPGGLTGLINFSGPPGHLTALSYHQVLNPGYPLPPELVRGRVVLVGRMLSPHTPPATQADAFLTPFSQPAGGYMSGVELQGHIIHTLLTGTWGRELGPWGRVAFYGAVLLGVSLLLGSRPPWMVVLLVLAAGIGVSLAAWAVLCRFRLWLFPMLLHLGLLLAGTGTVLGHHLRSLQEKRWLRQAFTLYVAPAMVEDLINHPDRLELGGEEVVVTALFADLAGFSRAAASLSPQELIQLLNEYFSPLTDLILAQGGTLDKYVADSLMAFWGAPLPQPDHARRACQTALDLQQLIVRLARNRRSLGLPSLGLRVGLHSGPVVAGNVGSHERFNYTILGDTVNVASRLERANRVYGTHTILSDATRIRAGAGLLVRELDTVQVQGRTQTVTIFELLPDALDTSPSVWLSLFKAGRLAYLHGDWPLACRCFEEVLDHKPGDGPALLYLTRCRQFQAIPPPPEWDGTTVLEGK
jgi:adenylate cyclase